MRRTVRSGITALLLCFLKHHHGGLASATATDTEVITPINRTQMSSGASYRNDFCARQAAVDNGTLPLALALADMDISVHLMQWSPLHVRTGADGRLDDDNPGVLANIMDSIATKGNFRWRDSFGLGLTPGNDGTNATFSEILDWALGTYDVSVGEWRNSLKRKGSGVAFPLGIADASIVMVQNANSTQFSWLNWTKAFTPWVWLAIVATYIVSAMVYRLIHLYGEGEHIDRDDKLRKRVALFDSFMTFNQHNQFNPQSVAGHLFTFSLNFFSLVIVASYTANLVTLLVVGQEPTYSAYTFSQAERKEVPICVWKDTSLHSHMKKKYPDAVLVETVSKRMGYEYLNEGKCQIVSDSVQSFRNFQRSTDINGKCSIAIVGSPDVEQKAGLAVNGGGKGCSSLLFSVLDYHLSDMNVEGVTEDAWAKHLDLMSSDFCTAEEGTEEDVLSLGMKSIGGIFILHGMVMVVALLVALLERCRANRTAAQSLESKRDEQCSDSTSAKNVKGNRRSTYSLSQEPSIEKFGSGQEDVPAFTKRDMKDMLEQFKHEMCEELKHTQSTSASNPRRNADVIHDAEWSW